MISPKFGLMSRNSRYLATLYQPDLFLAQGSLIHRSANRVLRTLAIANSTATKNPYNNTKNRTNEILNTLPKTSISFKSPSAESWSEHFNAS